MNDKIDWLIEMKDYEGVHKTLEDGNICDVAQFLIENKYPELIEQFWYNSLYDDVKQSLKELAEEDIARENRYRKLLARL